MSLPPAARPIQRIDPDRPGGRAWLVRETDALLEFATGSRVQVGFGWLTETGGVDDSKPVELFITGRMTHVFALAVIEGKQQYAPLLQHGLDSLTAMQDAQNGGWNATPGATTPKGAYEHTFVILAAASATVAGHPDGPDLLRAAVELFEWRFLDDEGMVVDQWDETFTRLDPYRGINSNMHAVEAFLAAGDALKDDALIERARVITERVVGFAAANGWRIPEHFDEQWRPQLEYNIDLKRDKFRPYGSTIGHSFEWARLMLQLATVREESRSLLLDAATRLFEQGIRDGWSVDGQTGVVYTVDWNGVPVVHERMHWVVAEGVMTADALSAVIGDQTAIGDETAADWYSRWWEWIDQYVIDRVNGSWWNELDRENHPSSTVWSGKPDIYHSVQTTMLPQYPLRVSLAASLADRGGR